MTLSAGLSPERRGDRVSRPAEYVRGGRLGSRRKHEFVGAHTSSRASHLSVANVADHEFAEPFVLEQAGRGLSAEDLPALRCIAELLAAEDPGTEQTDSGLAGIHSYADGGLHTVGPIMGCDRALGGHCANDRL